MYLDFEMGVIMYSLIEDILYKKLWFNLEINALCCKEYVE